MKKYQKPEDSELRKMLTPEQYAVTQKEGTEKPFQNLYWDHKESGIYVDAVSGEPLFSSLDKYDSGTGWPSLTKPLKAENVKEHEDRKLFMKRVEVRSQDADSHLGHVFDDGPGPTGQRYCINSASLRFIPIAKLKEEGYAEFLPLFAAQKKDQATATFAAGCFWGVEEIIRKIPGVIETTVGYTGGSTKSPTYKDISRGNTGHAEALRVVFDSKKITYEDLLGYFFRLHDPTTQNRQGNDVGTQYRSAIFYEDETQRQIAEKVKKKVQDSGKWQGKIVTEIVSVQPFYPAEDYHQNYLEKNPEGYTCHYLRD